MADDSHSTPTIFYFPSIPFRLPPIVTFSQTRTPSGHPAWGTAPTPASSRYISQRQQQKQRAMFPQAPHGSTSSPYHQHVNRTPTDRIEAHPTPAPSRDGWSNSAKFGLGHRAFESSLDRAYKEVPCRNRMSRWMLEKKIFGNFYSKRLPRTMLNLRIGVSKSGLRSPATVFLPTIWLFYGE
ncbi:hypothetical protein BDQ17DRAFT_1428581 [Cyathus striatus]|nr:hypothetical protein BDQ17DRAFT_1428581 [Cyathus striatus]